MEPKVENAEKIDELEPYCQNCTACGVEECCSPLLCKMNGGKYCDHYLKILKKTYKEHQWLLTKIDYELSFPGEAAMTYDLLIEEYELYVDSLEDGAEKIDKNKKGWVVPNVGRSDKSTYK